MVVRIGLAPISSRVSDGGLSTSAYALEFGALARNRAEFRCLQDSTSSAKCFVRLGPAFSAHCAPGLNARPSSNRRRADWWSNRDSNPEDRRCKRRRSRYVHRPIVWSGWLDSNQRPPASKAGPLRRLSLHPERTASFKRTRRRRPCRGWRSRPGNTPAYGPPKNLVESRGPRHYFPKLGASGWYRTAVCGFSNRR